MKVFEMKMRLIIPLAVMCCLLGIGSQVAQAQTTYTNDPNIADFTAGIASYATLSNFSAGDVSSPFTPTSSELALSGSRVYNGTLTGTGLSGSNWILATFSGPVSTIVVFPNIDHLGSGYDGYQYKIAGSNDGVNWTLLFDALTVKASDSETGEPFTLDTFTGTAPSTVNYVLTPGAGPGGTVGYIAQFNFGTAYKYYAFGASTEAAGNTEQELSAVGASSTQTQTLGGPGTQAIFTFNTDTYKITGVTNQGGEQLTVTAFLVPASSFPTGGGEGTGLNGFSTETCIPYGDYSKSVDTCVEFQTTCLTAGGMVCDFIYLLATGYDLPADLIELGGIGGPDFLVAHRQPCPLTSASTVQSIFLSYEATIKDPTTRGGSRGPSCFVATYTPGAQAITTGTTSSFDGWEPPVSNTKLNQVKAGSVRRLKFQLFNNLGNPVTHLSLCNSFSFAPATGNVCNDPTVHRPWVNLSSFGIACPDGTPKSSATDEAALSSADNSGLLNHGSGNYVFRWQTEKDWKGLCANVTATFDSGLTVVPATKGFHFNSAGDDKEE
jgi:hypothetical protein